MGKRNPTDPKRNISELRYTTSGNGWWVRFNVSPRIRVSFYDSQYNGHENALLCAQRFRDAIERELEPARERTSERFDRVSKRSKTGIPGVEKLDQLYVKDGYSCRTYVWRAWWPTVDGPRRSKTFSIRQHGEENARSLAIAARMNGLHEFRTQFLSTFRPPKKSYPLWRYMDFTKFVAMLEQQALFFPAATLMTDAFEGGSSRGNEALRPLVSKCLGDYRSTKKQVDTRRNNTFISCWHGNETESAAMWKLYSTNHESICIQTTFDRLRRFLPLWIDIGEVQYIDFEQEWVPERDDILPFLYKRKSFEHEKEFRALFNLKRIHGFSDLQLLTSEKGSSVPGNLSELIERVVVAPDVSPWFRTLVEKVVQRYGLNVPVTPSILELKPRY